MAAMQMNAQCTLRASNSSLRSCALTSPASYRASLTSRTVSSPQVCKISRSIAVRTSLQTTSSRQLRHSTHSLATSEATGDEGRHGFRLAEANCGKGAMFGSLAMSSTRKDRWQVESSADAVGSMENVADGGWGGDPPGGGGWGSGRGKGPGGGDGGGSGDEGRLEGEDPGNDGGLWARYCFLVEKYPILTKAITAAFLNFVADLFCQVVLERSPRVDLTRLLGFAAIGLFIVGPCLHIWYGLLPRIISVPGDKGTLIRLALDQLIFAPASLACFFGIVLTLEGKPGEVLPKLEKDLMPTVFAQWKVWIPFQFANFKFVPPSLQVASASALGVIWTVYVSLVSHRSTAPSTQPVTSPADSSLATS